MSARSETTEDAVGLAARAGAHERQFADGVSRDGHRVADAHDLRDGRGSRHHRGMDALLDAARSGALGHAQQLDAIAQLVGHAQIERRDGGDSLHIDRLERRFRWPKARLVRTASLWAVSNPPTSKVGSASA
jgi:hypothetical protein